MCLIVKKSEESKILEEDVVCYKVLAIKKEGVTYYSPYIERPVNPEPNNLVIAFGDEEIEEDEEDEDCYRIECGFIHCMLDLEGAEELAYTLESYFGSLWGEKYEIFKCTIPKGTKVYYGEYCVDTNCYPAIAAKQIIFNESV